MPIQGRNLPHVQPKPVPGWAVALANHLVLCGMELTADRGTVALVAPFVKPFVQVVLAASPASRMVACAVPRRGRGHPAIGTRLDQAVIALGRRCCRDG